MSAFWYRTLYPFFIVGAWVAAPFSRKIRHGLLGRLGLQKRMELKVKELKSSPYWFHVASSGEMEQAIPILEQLRALSPQTETVLTYFSPSGEKALRLEAERREKLNLPLPWTLADYSPFDFMGSTRKFIAALRPKAFICIHREIWPGILKACRESQIPSYLFASYLPESQMKVAARYRAYLPEFKRIGTVDAASAQRLAQLTDVPVETVGDPRTERVLQRKARAKIPPWASLFEGQRVLVLASLWPADWRQLLPGIEAIQKQGVRVVVVPHEPKPSFVEALQKSFPVRARRWSSWLKNPDLDSTLVVDGVGFLAELYQIASFVFVGGSFTRRVHNILEPAAYGIPIFTGPFIENSCEACLLRETPCLKVISTGEELSQGIGDLLAAPQKIEAIQQGLESFLKSRSGSSLRYAELLIK